MANERIEEPNGRTARLERHIRIQATVLAFMAAALLLLWFHPYSSPAPSSAPLAAAQSAGIGVSDKLVLKELDIINDKGVVVGTFKDGGIQLAGVQPAFSIVSDDPLFESSVKVTPSGIAMVGISSYLLICDSDIATTPQMTLRSGRFELSSPIGSTTITPTIFNSSNASGTHWIGLNDQLGPGKDPGTYIGASDNNETAALGEDRSSNDRRQHDGLFIYATTKVVPHTVVDLTRAGLTLSETTGTPRVQVGVSRLTVPSTGTSETSALSSLELFDTAGNVIWQEPSQQLH